MENKTYRGGYKKINDFWIYWTKKQSIADGNKVKIFWFQTPLLLFDNLYLRI